EYGNLRAANHFDFADDSVSSSKFSTASGGAAQSVAMHTNGEDMFKNFDWCVECICHMAVCGVPSGAAGPCAGATGNCLVVGKRSAIMPSVCASEREIVH